MKYLETDEFISLSSEEKKEYIRNLIHSEAAGFHAAFLNPETGTAIEARELIEKLGEERALEIMVKSIEDGNSNTKAFTGKDIQSLIEKAQRGRCTSEELTMLNYIMDDIIKHDSRIHFEFDFIEMTLNIINHFQKNDNPMLSTMLSACSNLIITSSMFNKNGSITKKYKSNDVFMVNEMCHQISEDIYDTWKASCNSLPDAEMIVIALLQLATKIANENKITFGKADDIANALGAYLDDCDETENGSNEENDCNNSEE